MCPDEFNDLTTWLHAKKSVTFMIKNNCLGRTWDNQFSFKGSAYESGMATFSFSSGLQLEFLGVNQMEVHEQRVALEQVVHMNVRWQGKVWVLLDSWILISE